MHNKKGLKEKPTMLFVVSVVDVEAWILEHRDVIIVDKGINRQSLDPRGETWITYIRPDLDYGNLWDEILQHIKQKAFDAVNDAVDQYTLRRLRRIIKQNIYKINKEILEERALPLVKTVIDKAMDKAMDKELKGYIKKSVNAQLLRRLKDVLTEMLPTFAPLRWAISESLHQQIDTILKRDPGYLIKPHVIKFLEEYQSAH